MGIVSSEPIVFVGPGSEWFWSMAQFVVVAITLIGIYYQFRLQRSASAFEQLNKILADWNAEILLRTRLTAGRALKAGKEPPYNAVGSIGGFWEGVASLVRRGHVDARMVYDAVGDSPRYWWALLENETRRLRAGSESSELFVHFEWLTVVFAGLAPRDSHRNLDRATLIAETDAEIHSWEDRIQILEASRMLSVARQRRASRGTAAEEPAVS